MWSTGLRRRRKGLGLVMFTMLTTVSERLGATGRRDVNGRWRAYGGVGGLGYKDNVRVDSNGSSVGSGKDATLVMDISSSLRT